MIPGLEFTVRIGCPNQCFFCPQSKIINAYSNRGPLFMSLQHFCAMLMKIPKDVQILFSGFSEPFLNPEASQMMKIASENGFSVAVYTTLVSLRPADIDNLKGIKFARFTVHIPDHQYFRYSTEKWLQNLILLQSLEIKPDFMSMGEVAVEIHELVDTIYLAPMISRAGTLDSIPVFRKFGRLTCRELEFKRNVVLPNGDVYLCCMDFGLQHKLGNLLSGTYDDLFKNQFEDIIAAANSDNGEVICRYCEWATLCRI